MAPLSLPLPFVTPISVGDNKKSGRTKPLQMHCQAGNDIAEYIVKLWAEPGLYLGKHGLAREVYGSLLARSLDIETPDIALVNIEPDFYLSQMGDSDRAELLHTSSGLNFGSKFIPGAIIFSPPVPPSKHSAAVEVFCFDMLICNLDRRIDKPNVFQTPNGFMVFDHEQAFPFSRPGTIVGELPQGWQSIKEPWHRNHVFYSSIKHHDCSLEIEGFISKIGSLSDQLLDTIAEQIPEDWRTGNDLQNMKSYLIDTRENINLFKRSLQEILA